MAEAITPNVPIAISASLNVDDARVLVRSTEAISDAANSMNQRIGLLVVDLAPDPSDIHVDDIGRRVEVKVPDMLQQHGARHHAAFIAREIFQELKLPGKKVDILAAPAGGSRDQVNRKIADAQDGLLGDGVAAPAKRLEASQQLDEREWLDQIVVATGAQTANPVVDFSERADDEKRCRNAVTRSEE